MSDSPASTLEAMRACARRELALRRRVYPRWVKEGRYSAEKALAEIAGMEAIVDHFTDLIEGRIRRGEDE